MTGCTSGARCARTLCQTGIKPYRSISTGIELLPGFSDCAYFRIRWADLKKHSQRHYGKDIDHLHDDLGIYGGLTRLDERKGKPTYAFVVLSSYSGTFQVQ